MLNELIQAAKAIEEQNITVRTYHPALMTLPNYPAYKVLVAANGALADIQAWPHDISNLRKWKLGENGYSFPVEPLAKHRLHAVYFAARGEIGGCGLPFLA